MQLNKLSTLVHISYGTILFFLFLVHYLFYSNMKFFFKKKITNCFLGLHGWFPAKLVEVLDERSKEYSFAGDDSVTQAITDLVRGVLCPAVKRIFEHGLRRYVLTYEFHYLKK